MTEVRFTGPPEALRAMIDALFFAGYDVVLHRDSIATLGDLTVVAIGVQGVGPVVRAVLDPISTRHRAACLHFVEA